MTGMFAGGKSGAKQPTAVGSFQFQTSDRGGVIPVVYGTTRVAGNLIDFEDFEATAIEGGGKGKGGGKSQTTGYTYSASILMGLCQGPIVGVLRSWLNKAVGPPVHTAAQGTGSSLLVLYTGEDGQEVDPYWSDVHPGQTRSYSGTAYIAGANVALGTTAVLPATSFEVQTAFTGFGPGGEDADPKDIITDFLTNPRYGADFPAAHLGDLTEYSEYCQAVGLGLSPQADTQQEAKQFLSDIAKVTNSAIVWTGSQLKIRPYGDTTVVRDDAWYITFGNSNPMTGAATVEVTITDPIYGTQTAIATTDPGQTPQDLGGNLVDELIDFLPQFNMVVQGFSSVDVQDDGIFSDNPGADPAAALEQEFTITLLQQPGLGSTTVSTVNCQVEVEYGGSVQWTPDLTAQYHLTDDDFITGASSVGGGGLNGGGDGLRSGAGLAIDTLDEDPVRIERSSPADAINKVSIEYRNRANHYNKEVAEAWDQASIDDYGLHAETSIKGDAICDPIVAQMVAQLVLQRALLFRNTYTFRLGWKYCLLEPMDLVTLTDSSLGLSRQPVRITAIEEDEEGTLTVTAEDFYSPEFIGDPGGDGDETVIPPSYDVNVYSAFYLSNTSSDETHTFGSPAALLNTDSPGQVLIACVATQTRATREYVAQVDSITCGNIGFTRLMYPISEDHPLPEPCRITWWEEARSYQPWLNVEIWWAYAPNALSNETVTVNLTGVADNCVWAVDTFRDISIYNDFTVSPLDAHKDSIKMAYDPSPGTEHPTVFISTEHANDMICWYGGGSFINANQPLGIIPGVPGVPIQGVVGRMTPGTLKWSNYVFGPFLTGSTGHIAINQELDNNLVEGEFGQGPGWCVGFALRGKY